MTGLLSVSCHSIAEEWLSSTAMRQDAKGVQWADLAIFKWAWKCCGECEACSASKRPGHGADRAGYAPQYDVLVRTSFHWPMQ